SGSPLARLARSRGSLRGDFGGAAPRDRSRLCAGSRSTTYPSRLGKTVSSRRGCRRRCRDERGASFGGRSVVRRSHALRGIAAVRRALALLAGLATLV